MKILKIIAFATAGILVAYMAAMTVIEKYSGTATVLSSGYHSPVFIGLWALLAVTGLVYFFRSSGRKFSPAALIHIAFVLILVGAALTHFTGRQGVLHLRVGEKASEYLVSETLSSDLPFFVTLEDFEISYYPGTYAASDYESLIKVSDARGERTLSISMNNIGKYSGYRFYQSSYDEDGGGSTLALSYDPFGLPLTYAGYALLLLGFTFYFFDRNGAFRRALKRVAGCALLLVSFSAGARTASELPDHLPEEVAADYGRMYIYYNERVCPMQSFARDFTMKLYGSRSYQGLTAEQVLTGWIFYGDSWTKTLSASGNSLKARQRQKEKEELVMLLRSAAILKIFPVAQTKDSPTAKDSSATACNTVKWYSSVDRLPSDMDDGQWIFIRRVMSLAGENIVKKDFERTAEIFRKVAEYQRKTAGDLLPSEAKISAERFYNAVERPKPLAMFCLTVGILLFILYGLFSELGSPVRIASALISALVFVYLTVIMGLRWYISAHVPMSNGFEVMLLLAWHTFMLSTFIQRRFPQILPFAFILGGFALLVASIGESNPSIAYLVPVLSSPLLSLHVMSMMISYTLLGLLMLHSAMALVRYAISGENLKASMDRSLIILYPAVFFLTLGTFLGAVWANVSWGRYWAWDPKEVWALITLMVYAFALHGKSLKLFTRPKFFHWFCILAFICVLATYFGVNFFLGGLHSYA